MSTRTTASAPPAAAPWDRPTWLDAGLRFECQRCGGCCTGSPGIVRLAQEDLAPIAELLRLSPALLEERHLKRIDGQWRARETPDGACTFFAPGAGCQIYACRPLQCRTYPFWLTIVRSLEAWERAARDCPGMGEGPLYERERIIDILYVNGGEPTKAG